MHSLPRPFRGLHSCPAAPPGWAWFPPPPAPPLLPQVFGKGNTAFWIVFSIIHIISTLLLSTQLYYMGRWRLGEFWLPWQCSPDPPPRAEQEPDPPDLSCPSPPLPCLSFLGASSVSWLGAADSNLEDWL